MIRRAGVAIGLASLVSVLALLFWSGNAIDDKQAAVAFFNDNRDDLIRLIRIAKTKDLPERVEIGIPTTGCELRSCKDTDSVARALLRTMDSDLMIVHDQCNNPGRCSVSVSVRRQGLSVSGSGTEVVYDTDPQWRHFTIHPIPGAGPGWYYRHLGDG